jgi:hypothetical protein
MIDVHKKPMDIMFKYRAKIEMVYHIKNRIMGEACQLYIYGGHNKT